MMKKMKSRLFFVFLAGNGENWLNGYEIPTVCPAQGGFIPCAGHLPHIAFSDVLYGYGNNNSGGEGARYKNLIYTNILGPILIKNPWFTMELIKIAMENKKIKIDKGLDEHEFIFELKSMQKIKENLYE